MSDFFAVIYTSQYNKTRLFLWGCLCLDLVVATLPYKKTENE